VFPITQPQKKKIKSWWKIVADTTCAELQLAANQKVIPSMVLGQRQNLVTIKQMKKSNTQMYCKVTHVQLVALTHLVI